MLYLKLFQIIIRRSYIRYDALFDFLKQTVIAYRFLKKVFLRESILQSKL
jgi:hypothetical protein